MALQKPLSKLKPKSQSPAPDQAVQPRPASPDRVLNGMPFTIPSRGPFYMKIRGPDSAVIDTDRRTTVAVKRRPAGRSNCPHCGGHLRPNGTRTVKYRDLSFGGKVTTLKWERQRFRCSECRRTCADTHPELHSRHMMTHRLVTSIIERSTRESNVAIAKDLGLDEKTVRNVLRVHDEGLEHY
jgi:transposase